MFYVSDFFIVQSKYYFLIETNFLNKAKVIIEKIMLSVEVTWKKKESEL